MKLTHHEYEDIILPLKKIPPREWLEGCKTGDQRNHFHHTEARFNLIHMHFFRFFSGVSEFQVNQEIFQVEKLIRESGKFSKKFIEVTEAEAVVYRAYYAVIFDGWKYLKPILDSAFKERAPETPAATIVQIIKDDCRRAFMPCMLPYQEVENRKIYEVAISYRQLLQRYEDFRFPPKKKERLDKAIRRIKSKSKSLDSITKLDEACKEFMTVGVALGRKDTVLKGSIREYWNRVNDYIDLATKRMPGYVWEHGHAHPMAERGGVVRYVKPN